jgi:hypothetical protein
VVSSACPAATRDVETCCGILDQANVTFHLVELATETFGVYVVIEPYARLPGYQGIPSCSGFDGIAPGGRSVNTRSLRLDPPVQ